MIVWRYRVYYMTVCTKIYMILHDCVEIRVAESLSSKQVKKSYLVFTGL